MDIQERVVRFQKPFLRWYRHLSDPKTRQIVLARLTQIQTGNFGDCKSLGHGVMELKILWGPGYRVYFGINRRNEVVLLLAGDKRSQRKDILRSHFYWDQLSRDK